MKSFKIVFVVAAMIGMTAGLAAVTQAETMYVSWVKTSPTYSGVLKAYSTAGVDSGISFEAISYTNSYLPQGIAVSPLNGNLYQAVYNLQSGQNHRILVYNPATGAIVNDNFYSNATDGPRPICFDSAGNLYAGLNNEKIAKITPAGVVDNNWGNSGDVVYPGGTYASSLEVRGGYLYAAVTDGVQPKYEGAVVRYDLSQDTNVDPELMTADIANAKASFMTFGPDGTMYSTENLRFNEVGKWTWNSTLGVYDTYTTFTPTGCSNPGNVVYFNGSLYLTDKGAPRIVRKYDIGSDTWTNLCQYPTASPYTGWTHGWMTVVPEPSTLALLACGLVGLLAYAWRKRK